ncbi:MAG: enoyl-CoA hydratase [Hyphomonadaceae bacterium]|nr:enoyl-CoA hydratase [Hyphomonadaceae bacterium]
MEYAGGRLIAAQEGSIGWITFNQPERLNAVRRDMWDDLPAAVASLTANPQTRVIVVKGAGDKAFISGADIAEFEVQRHDAASNRSFTAAVTAATSSLIEAGIPVVAMINGFCIGGGMVIASACDIRICSEGSRFGVPAGKLGLGYELDNLARLQSIVGRGIAMEMLATARHFSAQEAMAAGFVNRIVPPAMLESTIREMAEQIAMTAPLSFAAAKLASRAAIDPARQDEAQSAIDTCFDSDDFKEGRAAFRDRRIPTFAGK